MNVSLSPEMARFVEEKVKTGQFQSPSEVINGALTAYQQAELLTPEALAELRDQVDIGIAQLDRGEGRPWDAAALKDELRVRAAKGTR
jgi:antitoxin ParD1/3/4